MYLVSHPAQSVMIVKINRTLPPLFSDTGHLAILREFWVLFGFRHNYHIGIITIQLYILFIINISSCFLLFISLWTTYGYEETTSIIDAG